MPISKTVKKGKEMKEKLVDQVRTCCQQYSHIYLFRLQNSRSTPLQRIRAQLGEEGRMFIGKNRVMALALGLDASSEAVAGGAKMAARLEGDVGLLFSSLEPSDLSDRLQSMSEMDWARTGNVAPQTVTVDGGELVRDDDCEPVHATCEPQLRQAGMPTQLRGGTVLLAVDSFTICEEGGTLTADQCRLLKLLGYRMAEFRVHLLTYLHAGEMMEMSSESEAEK